MKIIASTDRPIGILSNRLKSCALHSLIVCEKKKKRKKNTDDGNPMNAHLEQPLFQSAA